jgi:hypothetical protein
VLSVCRRELRARLAACGLGEALVDGEGRFAPPARACYAALQEVLARVRLMAAATSTCCRCAAQARCARSAEACNLDAARGLLDRTPCLERSCAEECGALLPEPAPVEPSPEREPTTPTPAVVPAGGTTKT